MAECIDRQVAIEQIKAEWAKLPLSETTGFGILMRVLTSIPAADVRPVRRGKWSIVYDDFMKSNYNTCSCCGKEYFGANGFNFCPNYGADMREES